jgi:hypothetical protein
MRVAMLRRMTARSVTIGAVLFIALAATVTPTATAQEQAANCTCAKAPDASTYSVADVIFSGQLAKADVPQAAPTGFEAAVYQFKVDRVFKGTVTAAVTVYSLAAADSCGFTGMTLGGDYVIFATLIEHDNPYRPLGTPDGGLYAGACAGSLTLGTLTGPPTYLGVGLRPSGAAPVASARAKAQERAAEILAKDSNKWVQPVITAALALAVVGLAARLIAGKRRTVV